MLAPEITSVPVPDLVTEPVPLTTPAYEEASKRLKITGVLFVTLLTSDPLVVPLPFCRVPVLTVLPPLYVLPPASTSVPAPLLVKYPLPLIAPERVKALE